MEKIVFALIMLMVLTTSTATHPSQNQKSGFQEVYTGTLMNMNGPARTTGFNLSIKDYTSDEDARAYLAMLVEGDQFDLLKRIQDLDLGFTSARHCGTPSAHRRHNFRMARHGSLPPSNVGKRLLRCVVATGSQITPSV